MAIGTAGYTAMLCVMELLQQGLKPDQDEIIVSGATGGVGTFSIIILSKMGFNVLAITGKPDQKDYLSKLGANEILDRSNFSKPSKLLESQRWAGAIDTAGGNTLANICSATKYGGTVVSCGNAESIKFNSSVAPFILRNIRLLGVDSVYKDTSSRIKAWNKIAEIIDSDIIDQVTETIPLSMVTRYAKKIYGGNITGRVIVDVNNF